MRAVNADALIPKIKCIMKVENQTFGKRSWDFSGKCLAIVENEPTIEPERKTGRWLPDNRPGGGFWVCSCCKFPSEAFAADKLYKYCPVCGCRMEEGDQND